MVVYAVRGGDQLMATTQCTFLEKRLRCNHTFKLGNFTLTPVDFELYNLH